MTKRLELIVAVVALVAIVCMDGAWKLKELTVAMIEAEAIAAVAQAQAIPIFHLGPML